MPTPALPPQSARALAQELAVSAAQFEQERTEELATIALRIKDDCKNIEQAVLNIGNYLAHAHEILGRGFPEWFGRQGFPFRIEIARKWERLVKSQFKQEKYKILPLTVRERLAGPKMSDRVIREVDRRVEKGETITVQGLNDLISDYTKQAKPKQKAPKQTYIAPVHWPTVEVLTSQKLRDQDDRALAELRRILESNPGVRQMVTDWLIGATGRRH